MKRKFFATSPHRSLVTLAALPVGALASAAASAGGLMLYEVGTADVGLASAGYGARAQDASTVFTNPAGMTRLEGTQVLVGVQTLYTNTEFTVDSGTSPELGGKDGGKAIGFNGWFPGGGLFVSSSVSPDVSIGFAMTGNFGSSVKYDNDWVGRYYVQEAALVGVSFIPSVAYKVNDHFSIGAGLNAMYGHLKQVVAVNNPLSASDGQLKLEDNAWGYGANVGLMYQVDEGTRFGLTWTSQVDLNFKAPAEFSGLDNGLNFILGNRGLLNANVKMDVKVPQTIMGSAFVTLNDKWAMLGSVGWQQWSKFGQVTVGIEDTNNPQSLTTDLDYNDTWHVALGAQYQLSEPWKLSFGIAWDSNFQSGDVSPMLPTNASWRYGIGAEQTLSKTSRWGVAAELSWGGTLDVDNTSALGVNAGGRGNVSGSYEDITTVMVAAYYSISF